jgi:predicted porin
MRSQRSVKHSVEKRLIMKFTKVAVATAAALLAVAASAQTANVTLYGSMRLALESASYKGNAGSIRVNSMENVSSRFGFRGREELGGGLAAIFQLESGFAADTGANGVSGGLQQIFSREAWVGLAGGFGTAKLGYGLTAYDDVLGWAHHQGANSWENRNNGVSGGAGFAKQDLFTNYVNAATCNSSAFDARYGNSISYETPDLAGFTVRTQYAMIGEAASKSCNGWDTAARYSNGPVRVGLTYAQHKNFSGIGGGASTGLVTVAHDQAALRGYASFDAGVAKIDATYETAKYKTALGSLKYKYWEIGALAPLGAFTLGAQYSQRDNGLAALYNPLARRLETSAGSQAPIIVTPANFAAINTVWNNGGGKHFSLTADYALSKRTSVRSYYTQLKNETGTKINVISSGLWHSF